MTRRNLIYSISAAFVGFSISRKFFFRPFCLLRIVRLPKEMTLDQFKQAAAEWENQALLSEITSRYIAAGRIISEELSVDGRFSTWRIYFLSREDFMSWELHCNEMKVHDLKKFKACGYTFKEIQS